MKKVYSILIVLAALCYSMSASAYVKYLLNEAYSSAQTSEQSGWVCPWDQSYLSLELNDLGKYVSFSPGNSGGDRCCYYTWSSAIYAGVEAYQMDFDFQIQRFGNDDEHYTEIVVLANDQHPESGHVATTDNPYIFSLAQNGVASSDGLCNFKLNGADSDINLETKAYKVQLRVNADGQVQYRIVEAFNTSEVKAMGSYTLNEGVNFGATGLYVVAGRFNAVINLFGIKIQTDVDEPYANKPNIYLSGINGNSRDVTVNYVIDPAKNHEEVLYYQYPGTEEESQDYEEDGEGNAVIQGITDSGVLRAWTECDGVKSEVTEFLIDCTPVTLVPAVATVSSVEAGYAKNYTIKVDRTQVPLSPNIFLHVKFTPEGEGTAIDEDIANGATVTVDSKGTLEVVATANGYEPSTARVDNDVEYELTKEFDFMAMSEEEVAALPYMIADTKMTDSRWFDNWHWGNYHNTDGSIFYFGKDADGNNTGVFWDETAGEWGTQRYKMNPDLRDEAYDKVFAPLKLWRNTEMGRLSGEQNPLDLYFAIHLGLWAPYNDYTGATYENTEEITIDGGYAAQFFVVEEIRYYGRNSHEPVVTVLKGNEGYKLYRYSSVIPRIRLFSPVGGDSGVQGVKDDSNLGNADAPIYNLSGVRMSKNSLPKGLYIQNGKKFIVK